MLLDRPHRERLIRPLRSAEMRADRDLLRPAPEQELERRQRRPDPRVVRHPPVLEWHVQIGTDEHALARDVRVANRPGSPHYALTGAPTEAATRSTRSASRQGEP